MILKSHKVTYISTPCGCIIRIVCGNCTNCSLLEQGSSKCLIFSHLIPSTWNYRSHMMYSYSWTHFDVLSHGWMTSNIDVNIMHIPSYRLLLYCGEGGGCMHFSAPAPARNNASIKHNWWSIIIIIIALGWHNFVWKLGVLYNDFD